MDLMNYVDIVRRRWTLVLAALGVALLVTYLTLPASPRQALPSASSYRATVTLVARPESSVPVNLATVSLYATVGEVPRLAAKRLGWTGEPQVLAAMVTSSVDPTTGALTVSSSGSDGPAAARRANVFAEELIAYFRRSAAEQAQQQRDTVDATLSSYAQRIARLDRSIARTPGNTTLLAQREALQSQYQALVAQATTLQEQVQAAAPVSILQRAVPIPVRSAGFTPPSSPLDRLLVGAGLGLALGLALALVVERLDSRLRTRDQAEDAFGLPVLAEIPPGRRGRRGEHDIVSAVEPGSSTAEAYRTLRSALLLLHPSLQSPRDADSVGRVEAAGSAILVTSARPAEGKTTSVANLAVAMAESGRSVLVLSLDFRNPSIHDYFDVPPGAGLSDLLFAGRPLDLPDIVRDTAFPGVRIATSGEELAHPGALLSGAKPLLARARELADVVLVDSPPILQVSDALDLSPHVDAALVVIRTKRTTAAQAAATHRLLSRLGVPALGAVLVGAPETTSFYGHVYGAGRTRWSSPAYAAVGQDARRQDRVHRASHAKEVTDDE